MSHFSDLYKCKQKSKRMRHMCLCDASNTFFKPENIHFPKENERKKQKHIHTYTLTNSHNK